MGRGYDARGIAMVQLVPNWRKAWKWLSMWFMGLAAVAQTAWASLPPDALAVIPADARGYITLGLVAAAMVSRLVDQGPGVK